jgi:hypothetical protein
MLRRIVSEFATSAAVAKELSLGLYEALAFLALGRDELEATFAQHDARIRAELPGF